MVSVWSGGVHSSYMCVARAYCTFILGKLWDSDMELGTPVQFNEKIWRWNEIVGWRVHFVHVHSAHAARALALAITMTKTNVTCLIAPAGSAYSATPRPPPPPQFTSAGQRNRTKRGAPPRRRPQGANPLWPHHSTGQNWPYHSKADRPLQVLTPNRLFAEFNMGAYGYARPC